MEDRKTDFDGFDHIMVEEIQREALAAAIYLYIYFFYFSTNCSPN